MSASAFSLLEAIHTIMQIFFLCRQPAADMSLRLVHIQHDPGLARQRWVDLLQAFGYVFMYRTLTYPKLLRRLSHRRIIIDDIASDRHRPLLNIFFHRKTPLYIFYIV